MHVLSSRFTAFYRFGLPALIIGIGVYFLTSIFFNSRRGEATALFFYGLGIIVAGVVTFLLKRRLKKVWVDEGVMFVSDYCRVAKVSLSEIDSISETDGYRFWHRAPARQITIRLKRDCEFGREITFGTRLELIKRPEGMELLEKLRSGNKI